MLELSVQEIRERLKAADAAEFAVLKRSLSADRRKGVVSAIASAERRLKEEGLEEERIGALFEFDENILHERGASVALGLDEVGRGCLAGPVAVGAVVLPTGARIAHLNDSKQLKPDVRDKLHDEIAESAVACVVEYSSPSEIDSLGIVGALKKAFAGAIRRVEDSGIKIDVVLLDGNPLGLDSREVSVVKGDATSACIAAASVFAKVERDRLMAQLDQEYPGYEFAKNKGYGTRRHMELIAMRGLSDIHRRSFCGTFLQNSLF